MEDQPKESPSATTTAIAPTTTTTDNPHPYQHVVDDDTEHQLGISSYLSPHHAGFSAVLKARYSDFVVHEVGLDGTVARLESLSMDTVISSASDTTKNEIKTTNKDDPKEASTISNSENHEAKDEASKKRKRTDNDTEENSQSEPSWSNLQSELSDMIGQDAAGSIIQFFQSDFETQKSSESNGKDETEQLYIGLPPIKDKDTRRRVHQWIRSSTLHYFVLSDTADDQNGNKIIRLWPKRHETKMPNYGKFDPNNERRIPKANQQPKQKRPEGYLQFVLYKENCDTHTAIKQVTQRLNRGGRNNNFKNNNHNNSNKVRVGYSGMKDKRGVTTQFCTLHQRSPHEIAWVNQPSKNNWSNNHYGGGNSSKGGVAVVRVGNFQYVNDELRLGSLRGNRFDVVLRNIQTDPSHDQETTKGIVAQSAEALKHGFVNYFGTQRFGKFHDTHLAGIAVLQGDFEKVVDLIMRPKEGEPPKILEARQKWQKRFNQLKNDASSNERAKAEASCAKFVLRSLGRFMASEVSVLESLSRNPLDYKRAFSCISKTMRMMFLHAVQSLLWNKVASFRIESLGRKILAGDLVVVVAGDLVVVEDENTPSPTVKVVTEDDIAYNKYSLEDVVLPLLGTKSERPVNESGKLFGTLLEEIGITVDMFKNVQNRDLSFPGDYRKLICRPADVDFSIVEYNDPVQPLLQTDLMKLNGVQVLENSTNSSGEKDKTPLLGMVVGFTLPSSAYATIALRELMKKPTSSEYQKELGLGSA